METEIFKNDKNQIIAIKEIKDNISNLKKYFISLLL
jgi:hypothetical protein